MTTDLRDKTIEELHRYCFDGGVFYGIAAIDELARRLSEAHQQIAATEALLSEHKRKHEWWRKEASRACAELDAAQQQIAERDASEARLLLVLYEIKKLTYIEPVCGAAEEILSVADTAIMSIPAPAKLDAAIIKAAEEVPDINDRKYGVFLPTQKFWNAIGALCQAVRAKKGEKG